MARGKRAWQGIHLIDDDLEIEEALEEAEAQKARERGEKPLVETYQPTEEDRKKVRDMAAAGIPGGYISMAIRRPNGRPISLKMLRYHFEAELFDGKINADLQIVAAVFKAALAGNVTAQAYWLNNLASWRAQPQRVEVTGKDGAPLQGPMSGVLMIPTSPENWEELVAKQQAELTARTGLEIQELRGES